MINENWREWFQPWILERGENYWKTDMSPSYAEIWIPLLLL